MLQRYNMGSETSPISTSSYDNVPSSGPVPDSRRLPQIEHMHSKTSVQQPVILQRHHRHGGYDDDDDDDHDHDDDDGDGRW
jgi:hypothetical protein